MMLLLPGRRARGPYPRKQGYQRNIKVNSCQEVITLRASVHDKIQLFPRLLSDQLRGFICAACASLMITRYQISILMRVQWKLYME